MWSKVSCLRTQHIYTPGLRETMWSKVSCPIKRHNARREPGLDSAPTLRSKVWRASRYIKAPPARVVGKNHPEAKRKSSRLNQQNEKREETTTEGGAQIRFRRLNPKFPHNFMTYGPCRPKILCISFYNRLLESVIWHKLDAIPSTLY